jgi:putative nucleotidyltransferase with HDIG domain
MTRTSTADAADVALALPELEMIGSSKIRSAVAEIWAECWRESEWRHVEDAPKSPLEPPEMSLVKHTRAVARHALACAEIARDVYGLAFDRDLLIAAALLHDVTKLVEWAPGTAGPQQTRRGTLIQHGVYAAHKAWNKDLPDEIVHVILSHTDQSRKAPVTWEGHLIRHADLVDSEALHRAGLRATDK